MQNALVIDAALPRFAGAGASVQQMPLSFLQAGQVGHVVKVRGKGDAPRHLENIGFVPGAHVKVVAQQAGNLIVEIKGSQVALDKASAQKVITA